MRKNIKIAGMFTILSFFISACSGSPQKMAPENAYEPGEASFDRRASENDERMVAYSASLELSVKDTDKTREMLLEYVKNYNGFIVKETENYITSRIPSENMNNFISNSKTLGKTENETKTGIDITDQYRDNMLRLESLKTVRDRYLALLEKAISVNDILSIEKELERVNIELESLEGKIKHAELSVSYSNVTVRFKEKAKPGPIGWIFYGIYRGIKWLFVLD